MRFPLSESFLDEAARFALRAGCTHCFHRLADGACGNGWPMEGQQRWPLEPAAGEGQVAREVVFCREFELG